MFLLNMNRKSYIGSLMAPLDLTLNDIERSKSWSVTFWVVGDLYGISQQLITTLIWMSQKRVRWRAGFFAAPAVFLVTIIMTRNFTEILAKTYSALSPQYQSL